VLTLRLFPTFQHSNSVSFEGPNVPVRLRTYPQIGQLDDDQNVEQAKADGRNHLSSFFIGPQGQKIILPGTLVGWHRAGFTQSDIAKRRPWARTVTAIGFRKNRTG
jgi:hypothetical protein